MKGNGKFHGCPTLQWEPKRELRKNEKKRLKEVGGVEV
jgi:hypothetical protein